MKHFALALLLTLVGSAAWAQEGPKACTDIKDSESRLDCYDGLFMTKSENVTPEGDTGDWIVESETSPIDDSTRVFLMLPGREAITNSYGQNREMFMTIACRENTTAMWITFGGHFMSDHAGAGRVTYRIDDQTADTRNFNVSSDNEALGLWNGGSSISFIEKLFGAEQLFVQARPFSDSAVNNFFDIGGIETAIVPLREACHW